MGQKLIRIMLERDEIKIEHARGIDFQQNRKYKKIVSSIRNIGLIEALSVYRDGSSYILLDGYLRLKAAEELGIDQVPCFVYQNRDSYTFNAMRNELSPLQESKMLKKAISHGVDEKDLVTVLNVKVDRIRQTKKLADSLVPEARKLLDKNRIFRSTAKQLTRVKEEWQHVILKKMNEVGNYNASYAKVLVMKTPEGMMRHRRALKRNSNPEPSQKSLFTQIKKGNEEIEFYARRYKENMKELMKQVVFFRSLLERDATSEYLAVNYSHMVLEIKKILTRSETEVLS
jgi:ParB-like chromosome segregation protein Spo0J